MNTSRVTELKLLWQHVLTALASTSYFVAQPGWSHGSPDSSMCSPTSTQTNGPCDVLQFLASDGKWMFMQPSVMKRMADSLKVALNYKPEPNWLTYLKLQELAERVDSELRNRGLNPRSRMDVQGLIWASLGIEEGKYVAAGGISAQA